MSKFEYGVVIPAVSRGRKEAKNVFMEMLPEQSIFIPFNPKRPNKDLAKYRGLLSVARTKRGGFGWEYVSRVVIEKVNDKERKGVRVWRTR